MPKDRVAYYYHSECVYILVLGLACRISTSHVSACVLVSPADIGNYYYGPGHPMKPHRLKLTHHLIKAYGLYRKMECYVSGNPEASQVSFVAAVLYRYVLDMLYATQRPRFATAEELSRFHSDDYVDFLRRVTPENCKALTTQMQKCAFCIHIVLVAFASCVIKSSTLLYL